MLMAYGHDDRVCAYPSFEAIAAAEKVKYTSVCLLVDKEEIGSVGATGMQSRFFENTVAEERLRAVQRTAGPQGAEEFQDAVLRCERSL